MARVESGANLHRVDRVRKYDPLRVRQSVRGGRAEARVFFFLPVMCGAVAADPSALTGGPLKGVIGNNTQKL